MKPIGEAECIRIYVQKDKAQKSGVMWAIYPPLSCKKEFEQAHTQGDHAQCSDEKHLMAVINDITGWKLSK